MPRRALRCIVELNVHSVSCPGVYLQRRDDIYLSVTLLGQSRRTHLTTPTFPLYFHQKFFFDKVFYSCHNPTQVADTLEDEPVLIELIQLSEFYDGGRLLASMETNARDFLYPYPQFSPTYSSHDRELLLERSMDFPGIAPKMEFSSSTTLEETKIPVIDSLERDAISDLANEISLRRSKLRRSGHRRSRSRTRSGRHRRPTVSSVYHSRCASPGSRLVQDMDDLDLYDSEDGLRRPFVVSKVKHDLIGRVPGSPAGRRQKIRMPEGRRARSRSVSPRRYRTSGGRYAVDDYMSVPRSSKIASEPGSYLDDTDSEVLEILSEKYTRPLSPSFTRPRARSPMLYRSSLRDRFERPYSPSLSYGVTDRVDRALRRNRSLDRLDRLSRSYSYELEDLEDEFDRARYRDNRRYLI